jgi:glycosyltransferase involved in cell wall biosynthesis
MDKISIAIPTHGDRWYAIEKVLKAVRDDDRVAEVVLVDDASSYDQYRLLCERASIYPKARVFHNDNNQFVFRNKFISVERASSEWVIVFDSDNILDRSYIDVLYKIQWRQEEIYQPCFARPSFDFREFSGRTIQASEVPGLMARPMFRVMVNAMNYFVNRKTFLSALRQQFSSGYDPLTSDSAFINYHLFRSGCRIVVVPGLEYDHVVHDGSTYRLHKSRSINQRKETELLLKAL